MIPSAGNCDCVEELEQKIKEHGWPKLRPVEALALRMANRRMAAMEQAVDTASTEARDARVLASEAVAEINKKMDQFHKALFDPKDGIIVKQDRAAERTRWTIVVVMAIAGCMAFLLGTLESFRHLLGR